MEARLLAWARAVKQRQRNKRPVLWLFTDAQRLRDPLPAIAKLPRFLSGVVFRHDSTPDRATLAKRIAILCRARGLPLVIAGDARLAARLGAGVHLRRGRWPGQIRNHRIITSSVHNITELRRAQRAGAEIIFVSPAFKTTSHPGQPALGATRWMNISKNTIGLQTYALGGVSARKLFSLARFCNGVGAITALLPDLT